LYCRWLSEAEGVPENEMCYPPIPEILRAFNDCGKPDAEAPTPFLKLPENYLERTGSRLPTEAEWEYACRAGTVTTRPWGAGTGLVAHYASVSNQTQGAVPPVGRRKPNDIGLFDMLGGVRELCLPPWLDEGADDLKVDRSDPHDFRPGTQGGIRGGSAIDTDEMARSAFRTSDSIGDPMITLGFRVVRTLR
jgi:formylglycine-generating enzyme required for sulfatase activity